MPKITEKISPDRLFKSIREDTLRKYYGDNMETTKKETIRSLLYPWSKDLPNLERALPNF
jgi:hypothetical protein